MLATTVFVFWCDYFCMPWKCMRGCMELWGVKNRINMLKSILIVGLGSFFGGGLRYYISTVMKNACGQGFPWGTLAVNVVGCFVFGVFFALFAKNGSLNNDLCLLLTTGVCGGFTTFSTFAHESMQLLHSGNIAAFAGYVAASLIAGLSFVALGYWLVK